MPSLRLQVIQANIKNLQKMVSNKYRVWSEGNRGFTGYYTRN